MTRICHITTVHPRHDVRIFEKECTSLAAYGFEVTLLVNDQNADEIKNGVKIVSLRCTYKNRIERATKIANRIYKRALDMDADIYHIHDPELLRIAVKLSKHQKKVIFDSHEFTAMQILTKPYLPRILRKQISKLYRVYEINAINKLSGLIVPCTYDGKDFFDKVTIEKVLIGNFPKLSLVEKCKNYETLRDQNKIGYMGSVSESRGIFHILNAARISGKKIVIVGEIPQNIKNKIKQDYEYENIGLLGRLSHDMTMYEISKCSVGLCLLQKEGQYAHLDNLPTKLYEYMALGIPSVVSDFPYYEKILEKYPFGIAVNPSDDEQIANAIMKILSDSKLYKEMAEKGIQVIYEEMNWEQDAEKLNNFYEMII